MEPARTNRRPYPEPPGLTLAHRLSVAALALILLALSMACAAVLADSTFHTGPAAARLLGFTALGCFAGAIAAHIANRRVCDHFWRQPIAIGVAADGAQVILDGDWSDTVSTLAAGPGRRQLPDRTIIASTVVEN